MPPSASPAAETLTLKRPAPAAWAEFDPQWYLDTYPSARQTSDNTTPDAVLRFYLDHGQNLGHSPNILFDEAWYRLAYPDQAAAVANGDAASGFDLYCRSGPRSRSPHWLFDERLYRRLYPDLTDETLAAAGLANGYDHYLHHGARERRIGHLFFDPAIYMANVGPEASHAAEAAGPFVHYLRHTAPSRPEVRTTVLFDPLWYLKRYPEVAEAIARGAWRSALHHYLANPTPTAFDPLPEFSESYYLARYPDIAAAVEKRDLRNGYRHFLSHGATECRSPGDAIDLRYYTEREDVHAALRAGKAPDGFTHYLAIGRAQGLSPVVPAEERVTEAQAKTLFRRKAASLLPLFGRHPIDFTVAGLPAVSVIVVVHNQFALTLMALASLRSNYRGNMELILIDSGSTDETRFIGSYLTGAKIIRFDSNIGYVSGCNAGRLWASADAVLLLNNDIELAPNAVSAALTRLTSDASIGAVGGKVIRTHGLLQEAGNIVWRDGTTTGYLRDASPLAPEANFVRNVDFCSAVFLLVRRALLDALGGFDEAFAPAYYEDADLCLRIAAAGARVVYDPSVVVHHHEYATSTSRPAAEAAIARNREIFLRKHQDLLATREDPSSKSQVIARSAGGHRTRALFIEDTVPMRVAGSGFVRSNDIIRVMDSLGCEVTVFPVYESRFDPAAVYRDMPDSVEVMYNRSITDLPAFLADRQAFYDVVWIARTHNLSRVRQAIEHLKNGSGEPARIILDTEAIVSQRNAAHAALTKSEPPFDLTAALRREFADACHCHRVVAVSEPDAAVLRELGLPGVVVVGHQRELRPTLRTFQARAGMLFVGAIHEMESPNYDSLCWFVDEVLPRIEDALQWETRLTVVGYVPETVSLDRFRDHPRVTVLGAVPNLEHLYDTHRLFVAPTRYAAGTPYKIYEAASFGLPTAATELLRRQMGWGQGCELLASDSNDPKHFAEQVVMLYRDPDLWQRLRDHALQRLRTENGRERYVAAVRAALET